MTLEDLLAREAIRDTMAKYNTAGDRLHCEEYAACFTTDGVIESRGVSPERSFRFEGREAILAWQLRWREGGGGVHGATFVRHHLTTSKIDLTAPDTARARTYWVAWTDIGPDHAGHYLDSFRKEDGQWLIAERVVRLDWEAVNSLFKAAIGNSR